MIIFDRAEVRVPNDSSTLIVHPLSLTLSEHRIALIGANGSGKSTIARLINGLVAPSSGQVLLRDAHGEYDTVRHGREVRRRVGFMFTDPRAQIVMPTAGEDVALSLKHRVKSRAERQRITQAALDAVGLAHRIEQSVHTLSGGQQQLLALTSVLAADPSVLVADEPTTLLDLRNARLIGDRLMGLTQQVVLATHDLELAARADRVLVIQGGRVVYDGAPAEAIAAYRTLVLDGGDEADTLGGDGA